MNKITSFKQIKEIIEPIAKDKFCTDVYKNSKGQSCFLGHIHIALGAKEVYGDVEGYGARQLTRQFIIEKHNIDYNGVDVNNSQAVNGYNEPEIKDRLMHMIEDGIEWENSKL